MWDKETSCFEVPIRIVNHAYVWYLILKTFTVLLIFLLSSLSNIGADPSGSPKIKLSPPAFFYFFFLLGGGGGGEYVVLHQEGNTFLCVSECFSTSYSDPLPKILHPTLISSRSFHPVS